MLTIRYSNPKWPYNILTLNIKLNIPAKTLMHPRKAPVGATPQPHLTSDLQTGSEWPKSGPERPQMGT